MNKILVLIVFTLTFNFVVGAIVLAGTPNMPMPADQTVLDSVEYNVSDSTEGSEMGDEDLATSWGRTVDESKSRQSSLKTLFYGFPSAISFVFGGSAAVARIVTGMEWILKALWAVFIIELIRGVKILSS